MACTWPPLALALGRSAVPQRATVGGSESVGVRVALSGILTSALALCALRLAIMMPVLLACGLLVKARSTDRAGWASCCARCDRLRVPDPDPGPWFDVRMRRTNFPKSPLGVVRPCVGPYPLRNEAKEARRLLRFKGHRDMRAESRSGSTSYLQVRPHLGGKQ